MSESITARSPRVMSYPLRYRDWMIPARTPVSMTVRDVSHDEDIFPHSYTFDPERWLAKKTKTGESLEKYDVSFQKGPRNCLGIKYVIIILGIFSQADWRL